MNRIDIGLRHERQTFYGMRIVVRKDQPKMQLSARVCEVLAPDFIAETNAWMLSFFGTQNLLTDGEYLLDKTNNIIYMNPRSYIMLREIANKEFRPDAKIY